MRMTAAAVRERAEQITAELRAMIDSREIEQAPMPLLMAVSDAARALARRAQLTDVELYPFGHQRRDQRFPGCYLMARCEAS
jgi:hypothetical protein